MGRKQGPDASLRGKRPDNIAKLATKKSYTRNPGHIANKLKRSEMYGKYLQQKRATKRDQRLARDKTAEELGADAPPKATPKTIDNTREHEVTMVKDLQHDAEIQADQADDEFSAYFGGTATPKVLVTTRPRPSKNLFYFIADLQSLIPGLHFYPRKSFSVKQICQFAATRDFTHLIVLSEKSKVCNGMTISHLGVKQQQQMPMEGDNGEEEESEDEGTDNDEKDTNGMDDDEQEKDAVGVDDTTDADADNDDMNDDDNCLVGPTAFFKLTNVITSKNIPNHGASTSHTPELNLHGFGTRLGHRVGRLLGSLFPLQDPQFRGRQVATFHNQRDFIFVRHHRYIFNPKKTSTHDATSQPKKLDTTTAPTAPSDQARDMGIQTRLQELGPRFTLKLRWLQEGTFDTQTGEYEYIHKRKEMDTSRRKFHL